MIPGRWKGYIIDDMTVSTDPYTLFYGEKAGVGLSPIGVYDWQGQLEHTVHSDPHGVYEVLLPSDQTTNAPTPSGMLSNMYYIYGNDRGAAGLSTSYTTRPSASSAPARDLTLASWCPLTGAHPERRELQAPGSQQTQVLPVRSRTQDKIFRVSSLTARATPRSPSPVSALALNAVPARCIWVAARCL